MAITSSAKKAIRSSQRKRSFNLARKHAIDKILKEFMKKISAKDRVGAEKLISSVYKVLDKAAKTGYIKKNTSSRLKSRTMLALSKLK
jgi:small subunit ribosomal protein S20